MNRNFTNETDLHIQYKLETGKHYAHQGNFGKDNNNYTGRVKYTKDYQIWLEDNLIKQINK